METTALNRSGDHPAAVKEHLHRYLRDARAALLATRRSQRGCVGDRKGGTRRR